ncbi:RcnB family protein [Phenylobacterium sp. LjRoot225]|uniref:RcnB family protein n=1 Tax=Phenylobacterium sp. LjRoot225 TaxID=3342285 RepID=UPI003ED13268
MKKLVIAVMAATTALTGVMSAGVAAAQPGYYGDRDRDRGDHDRRDHDRRDRDRRDYRDHRDDRRNYRDHRSYERNWDRWYRHDRWSRGDHRYYGGRYGYNGYRGHWRSGERYPYWRENRYVISDYRAYRLPPPRPGYRYYRDDNGDIVMVAIASGIIGMIIGSSLND